MNRYKNKYGCHTPELTKLTMQALMAEFPGIEWNDESWHNDAADSITCKLKNGNELRVWLPNDEEDLPDYGLMISTDIEPIRDEAHKTLQDIIKELIPLIEVKTILQT